MSKDNSKMSSIPLAIPRLNKRQLCKDGNEFTRTIHLYNMAKSLNLNGARVRQNDSKQNDPNSSDVSLLERKKDIENFLNVFYDTHIYSKMKNSDLTKLNENNERRSAVEEFLTLLYGPNITSTNNLKLKLNLKKKFTNDNTIIKSYTILNFIKDSLTQKRCYSKQGVSFMQRANISIFKVKKVKHKSKKEKMKIEQMRKCEHLQPQRQPPYLSSVLNIISNQTIFPRLYPIGFINQLEKYTNPSRTRPIVKTLAQNYAERELSDLRRNKKIK